MEWSKQDIVDYLLRKMPEERREAFAASYFGDEEMYDEVLFVETELLDDLVRGRLDSRDAAAFEQYLDGLPGSALRKSVAAALSNPRNRKLTRFDIRKVTARSWRRRKRVLVAVAAMLLVSLALPAGYILSLRRQLGTATSERLVLETKLRASEEQLRSASQQAQSSATQQRPSQTRAISSKTASIDLDTNVARDAASPIAVVIPKPEIKFVVIGALPPYRSYSAWVQNSDGLVLWRSRPIPQHRRPAPLTITVPSSALKEGSCKLTLFGTGASSIKEEVAEWYFEVHQK